MKSNRDLGFLALYGNTHDEAGEERSWATAYGGVGGLERSWATAYGGVGGLWINVTIGKRGSQYRVYGYLWHHDRDVSREEEVDSLAVRGDAPLEALEEFGRRARSQGWDRAGVEKAITIIQDDLAEAAQPAAGRES